ncbi:MAG: type I methionyl aminopeptidase [Eubacteriales bacterium]|nr:type I methionyl aminopeptidase [Eubacteriales bacterium]
MAVTIKSAREIELMREAGRILAIVHEELEKYLRAGLTTADLDRRAEEIIRSYGCIPSFKGYGGFPASVCVSVNDEVVHGIPTDERIIRDGDIVSIDGGVIYKGFQSDAARTWGVGEISDEAAELIRTTKESFYRGIAQAKAGNHLYDISKAIGNYCEERGYGVVRELVGHGIGRELHEDPQVPNFEQGRRGMKLRAGMTLAIEPMVNVGTYEVDFDEYDGWTVRTRDGSLSAHYENTILITEGEPEILSIRGNGGK